MIVQDGSNNGAVIAMLVGGVVAYLVMRWAIRSAPEAIMRTNVDGKRVPAVLGAPIATGGLVGVLFIALVSEVGWIDPFPQRLNAAVALIVAAMAAAGFWDDRRGDERPRGFKGHLGALRRGRLTGGLVKLAAGGLVGLVAGRILTSDVATILQVGLLVALGANMINLMDRAPGRAGKFALLFMIPLASIGSTAWAVACAGAIASLVVCLPADLSARAMLGDAGANPLGGVIGLGLALSLDETWRLVAILVLVLLNLASEKWSFSRVIERVPPLRAFDMWGRPRPGDSTHET